MTEPTSPAAHTFYVWQNLAIHMGSGIPADLHRDFPVQICLALDWSLALRGGTREHWRLFTAALISVPFQLNFDQDIGPQDEGERWLLNVQPVVPFDLHDDWNVISRTILPLVSQSDIFPGAASQSGIVDVVQSVFFSPKAPTANGWISGAGPVLLLPTGSDELLTADQWAAGPTGVALKLQGPYACGPCWSISSLRR